MVQDADASGVSLNCCAGEDKNLGQYFAVLTNTVAVGVMVMSRTYDYAIACVQSHPVFYHSEPAYLPWDLIANSQPAELKWSYQLRYGTIAPKAVIEFE